ncbi:helix-turn-helix transcriptional regulator [Paraburkholderia pallida]|uniref:LuxR family transcriptional regulator n=1 Tax=Paraburkholderia pallida TaxID=2547399 RepID=A0A4P7D8Z5_9BURK|nr:helix-turn-helix transcriptional regulator [Paraburkholderia pallida]QBR03670.1 LuxR family transcriptional regulator [Paraburkholderia pallida]
MNNLERTAPKNGHSSIASIGLTDDWILADAQAFSSLTSRERTVCIGILTGYTSEGIALNLGISINSVLTYRKRVYEKLGITSQNELFMLTFRHLLEQRAITTQRDSILDEAPGVAA